MQPIRSRRACARGVLLSALVGSACVAPAPEPRAEERLAQATGADVRLRSELPLDERALDAGRLPLANALACALVSDPLLQAALARVRVAQAEADQARLLPNPVLDVALRFPSGGGRAELDAGVAADLLAVLTRPRRAATADDRLARSVAEALVAARALVLGVHEDYATVQALDGRAALVAERGELAARWLEHARARLGQGEASALEVSALEALGLQLELEAAEIALARGAARLALARRVGQPSTGGAWELEPWAEPAPLAGDEAAWIAQALEARPELQALRWELAALAREAGLAGLSAWQGAALGVDLELREIDSFGPAASIPLPFLDTGRARTRGAEARLLAARHEYVARQRAVVEDVRRAALALTAAEARLTLVRGRRVPLEEQRRARTEQLYLAGECDVSALLRVEDELRAAQGLAFELERERSVARARLEYATGGSGATPEVTDVDGSQP